MTLNAVPAWAPARHVLAILLVGTAMTLSACGGSATPSPSRPADATGLPPGPTATAGAATPDPAESGVTAAVLGSWLPKPVAPALVPRETAAVEQACRAALIAAPETAPASTTALQFVDFRGLGLGWALFADSAHAASCRATIAPDFSVEVTAVESLDPVAAPPADDDFVYVRSGQLDDVASGRTFAIGRVGRLSVLVIATFPDESFTFASLAGGWFEVWWPGATIPVGIGGTDSRHLVVKGLPLPTPAP